MYNERFPSQLWLSGKLMHISRRTTLQHYLFKDGLNYLLHPSIPTDKSDLKIAEIGVGTG